jgi:aryl-alcohol dehydrogenase-like predicted oxidoreductase
LNYRDLHPIGIGCMRLSTERDRDDTRGIAVLHTALDAGVTFLDTADAYCWDDSEIGHNERLIARALASWNGDRSRIVVATKGGLTRPNGQWVPDARARHLREACEASLKALGVERIDVYQLHTPDPRMPLATTVRALAALKDEGLVERIGLCNVKVGQIEEARRIAEISAVQVEVSVWHDEHLLNGVVEYCITRGIQLIAYRPLGGRRRQPQLRHAPELKEVADRHRATPAEIALAWLHALSPHIVSIPGPTKVETVPSIVRALAIQLSDEDRERLDARFGRGIRRGGSFLSAVASAKAEDPPEHGASKDAPLRVESKDGEIVLIMGLPGAGKSTAARALVDAGYARLNRDAAGGSLAGLLPELQRLVEEGHTRIVLDNTYMSRASRARVVQAATHLGLPVRCVWIATSVEDAQVNAVSRIIANHGRLLGPEEMKQAVKRRAAAARDISAFAPGVQFRHQRELEPPDAEEGFSRIDVVPFERKQEETFTNRALIVWCDETLANQGSILRRYRDEGWQLLGLAWRPEIDAGTQTREQIDAEFARIQDQLGVSIDVLYCPHAAGPPKCWCRKPLPGLGVVFIQRHRLDPSQCIYVGPGPQDPVFARRLGFQYRDAREFFGVRS